jgi:hypothetical protein
MKHAADRNGWRDFYAAEAARPICEQCKLPMIADPAPRRVGLKPVAPGLSRTFWLCSWCWSRRVVETGLTP